MLQDALPSGLKRAVVLSGIGHSMAIVLLLGAGFFNHHRSSPPQNVLTTKLVRLGKERPKDWLPRKTAPKEPEKVVPLPAADSKPLKDSSALSAQDRIKELSQVTRAIDRLKHNEPPEEDEGHPDGARGGEETDVSRALLGNKFATEVYTCLKQHYDIEGVDASRVQNRDAVIVVRVARDGHFIDWHIDRGSGLAAFDRAVEKAVQRCGRVSAPPEIIRDVVQKDGIEVVFQP